MLAPFTPFMAESLYQNLVVGKVPGAKQSVHLDSFPIYRPEATDKALEDEMDLIKNIAEAGRNARQTSGVRLRQPLSRATVVTAANVAHLDEDIQILMDELNVKSMDFVSEMPQSTEGVASAEGKGFTILIDMAITPELEREGMARDIVRRIQSLRKDMDLQYDRAVRMGLEGDEDVLKAMDEHREYITRETLASEVIMGEVAGGTSGEWDVLGKKLKVWLLAL